ncbi:DUF262 domain-containing protein [Bifidobacterium tissieri]|uniref:DUF262 domain-containing protein n=1 Tax=Bifidobacterium tissieri TaxID=1630162 RepID=A0A5N0A1F6_9BIFI|nr:DUF262 domain-containing protein [Bifidobacterium tissieri]KAA8828717.1 DUF262 domain-containing protein [Bifidobacterium tissieri]KAA8833343.1 DUF262 domain-containing protein [Bifidobacterium tissieri]
MGINASEKPLGKVFSTDYQFVIPAFQRAYSWQVNNMLQLVEDLEDAARDPEHPYFLGSLILVGGTDSTGRLYQVIDGQQRLTSLTIIIAILRDLETDPELVANLNTLILEEGNRLFGREAEPRLALRERDAEFFRNYVQEGNLESLFDLRDSDMESNAQRNIVQNTKAAYDALDALDEKERRALAGYLVSNVFLIIVRTDDLAGAHRIFDVMNMRGLPLTASDVFKAKAVSAIPLADRDIYGKRWDDAIDPLGDDVEAFFNDLLLVTSPKSGMRGPVDGFRIKVFDEYLKKNTAAEFINDILAPYARAWLMVNQPHAFALSQEVSNWLVSLNDFQSTEWKPVAMWALTNMGGLTQSLPDSDMNGTAANAANAANDDTADTDGKTGKDADKAEQQLRKLVNLLAALERVTGVDNLARQTSAARRTRVVQILKDLKKGKDIAKSTGFAISDDERKTALARLRGELQATGTLKKLLLLRANDQRAGERIVRPRNINVVRILPERIGANSSFAVWPESTRDHWVDRIGNLVLTSTNEQIIAKLDSYAPRAERILAQHKSLKYPLTAELESVRELTPDVLERRQEEIVHLIAEYWRIRFDADKVDLTTLSEDHLTRGSGRSTTGSKRITIAQVIDAGLLVPGETLVWKRPRLGQEWIATVTRDGKLQLEDGSKHSTPTAAARAASGKASGAGLDVWRRQSNGQKLSEIWQAYRLKALGGRGQ